MRLDVASTPGGQVYGVEYLVSAGQSPEIAFTLDKTRRMAFRVWTLGNEEAVFRSVQIKRLSDSK